MFQRPRETRHNHAFDDTVSPSSPVPSIQQRMQLPGGYHGAPQQQYPGQQMYIPAPPGPSPQMNTLPYHLAQPPPPPPPPTGPVPARNVLPPSLGRAVSAPTSLPAVSADTLQMQRSHSVPSSSFVNEQQYQQYQYQQYQQQQQFYQQQYGHPSMQPQMTLPLPQQPPSSSGSYEGMMMTYEQWHYVQQQQQQQYQQYVYSSRQPPPPPQPQQPMHMNPMALGYQHTPRDVEYVAMQREDAKQRLFSSAITGDLLALEQAIQLGMPLPMTSTTIHSISSLAIISSLQDSRST